MGDGNVNFIGDAKSAREMRIGRLAREKTPPRESRRMMAARAKTLLLLHILLLFYSLADVASKFAAGFDLLSVGFVVCYGIVLVVLAGYALGWQQVIKRLPLTTAYANRGITVVWGMFWGALLFSESITPFKLVGAAMIIAGIALFSHAEAGQSISPEELGSRHQSTSPKESISVGGSITPEETASHQLPRRKPIGDSESISPEELGSHQPPRGKPIVEPASLQSASPEEPLSPEENDRAGLGARSCSPKENDSEDSLGSVTPEENVHASNSPEETGWIRSISRGESDCRGESDRQSGSACDSACESVVQNGGAS